jgi:hypothetical protein
MYSLLITYVEFDQIKDLIQKDISDENIRIRKSELPEYYVITLKRVEDCIAVEALLGWHDFK